MSNYLKGVLDGYSLPATLPTGLGELASAIVDGYIRRPEGLVYVADNNGNPCAMAGMSPTITYTITGAVDEGVHGHHDGEAVALHVVVRRGVPARVGKDRRGWGCQRQAARLL